MRELKFRAWDDVAKRMSYSSTEQFDDMLGFRFDHFETDKPIYMQYTGLKDKNGKEIYEGDILRFVIFNYDGSNEGIKTGFVSWEEQAAAYVIRESLESMDAHWMYVVLENDDEVEVIGNIYEHPHLMKGDEIE